jgi:carbon monoxide dehydrogenase subunit G
MHLEGKTTIAAPREKVWAFLTDPTSVSRCAPGFESIEVVVPGRKFRALAAVGLGTLKARFATEVEWLDLERPSHARMKAHGTARVGAADVTTEMTLADGPNRSTELTWTAEVTVVGTIAAQAARFFTGISAKLTNAFFACVRKRVEVSAEEPERSAKRRRVKRV